MKIMQRYCLSILLTCLFFIICDDVLSSEITVKFYDTQGKLIQMTTLYDCQYGTSFQKGPLGNMAISCLPPSLDKK